MLCRTIFPSLFPVVAAFLLAFTLTGCMGSLDTPIELDATSVENKLLAESSDGDLLDRGAELYGKGNYEAAARRLRVLVDRSPHDFEAVAYLGLSLWFTGRAEDAAALWEKYGNPDTPEEGSFLRAQASGLRLLADRLRARSILDGFRRGELTRMSNGSVALLPTRGDEAQAPEAPMLLRGLHRDLQSALSACGPLQPAPGGLSLALLAESTAEPQRVEGTDALRTARILGAEYAVTMAAWTPPGTPDVLRTRITAQATEPLPLRARRLARDEQKARSELTTALVEEKALKERRERCSGVLDYFSMKDRLDDLLRKRDREAASASRMNQNGNPAKAIEAIRRYQATQEELLATQQEMREFERNANPVLDGAGRFSPEAYRQLAKRLDRQISKAHAQAADAARREREAHDRAAVDWRAARSVEFDIPLAYLSRWRMQALRELSRLTGEPTPMSCAPGPGAASLAMLHQGLTAWDDGEYAMADTIFHRLKRTGMTDLPTPPAAGFDLLQLLDMPPEALAARLERDVVRGPQPAWLP